ncbi:Ig-like domain-containing protein [Bacillus tianshenii]|uniref:Ig-like domain-containing protein n=1 Tax=Sutcliffiella tianshenii TaxID=1463404 RepID=UPI001CD68BC4|nr:Ig-like domain-containing protein [Bacillus tianshenii]MCA1322442.1 Ig-like domain-containing protein [Bacillus tianshenii]
MNNFKRLSIIAIAGVLLTTLLLGTGVQAALYVNGPTVDLETITVSNNEVGPDERVHISMQITDEDPIGTATVTYKSQLNVNKVVVLSYNEESGLFEGSLTIEDYFDIGEWTLYEISVSNSLNERTLIYADYIKDDRFRTEDLSEFSFFVSNTNPPTIDMTSFSISDIQQYEHKLDLEFRMDNPQYLYQKVVTVGYLGPEKENSTHPNIKYFQMHVDEEGFVRSGGRTPIFSDQYETGEWKLISISLPVEQFGKEKRVYDSDYNKQYNIISTDFGTADLSAGNFTLQEKASGMPLIDVTSLQVEKDVYTAGETVKISIKPLEDEDILGSLTINYRYPNSNETIGIGGYYDHDQQKYLFSYPTTGGTQAGEWIIDSIQQDLGNGMVSSIYNSRVYGDDHYDLNSGSFTIIEDLVPPAKPEVTEVTDQMTEVKGTAEPESKVEIKVNDKIIGEGTAENDGTFTVEIPKQHAGTELAIFAIDTAGNRSEGTLLLVSRAPKSEWIKMNNAWYYFDAEKNAYVTGWLKDGMHWYYLSGDGKMKTGWTLVNHKWYYLNNSGQMQIGWLKDGVKWYYLESSGAMKTGWLKDGGKWYYLESSGAMKTGWLKDGGKWYYLDNSGMMKTGWIQSGGKWYYLYSSGVMAYSTTIGGYRLGADGAWIQ